MTAPIVNLFSLEDESIKYRNLFWANNDYIPSWVDIDNVGLDQFFTQPEVAKKCYDSFIKVLKKNKINTSEYIFVEPSAGSGSFYNLLPENKIGFDIMPLHDEVKKQDFLSWMPNNKNKKYLFIGNPPFGYRAWAALSFMNHAAQFGEYIGFILPMAFQSDARGSAKHRVKGMTLIHSEIIDADSFYEPNGKVRKVNALWQIWKKGDNIIKKKKTCNQWVDIFTVDLRKERLCGQVKMQQADFFLQRTYYKEPPSLVKYFSEVKYTCGYGFIIKKSKKEIIDVLNNTDWEEYCNLAAHNCKHISMYHIEKALTDRGFIDV
jgi:hypothetical protein